MACAQVMDDKDLARFRTKLCQRHLSGGCEFNGRCQYSHSKNEHRRRCPFLLLNKEPLTILRYVPMFCQHIQLENSVVQNNNSGYWETSSCPQAAGCPFAHSIEEILYHPLVYKSKLCAKYHQYQSENIHYNSCNKGGECIKNNSQNDCCEYYCSYIHNIEETRNISIYSYFLAPSFAKRLTLTLPEPLCNIPVSKINTSKLSDTALQEAPWLRQLVLTDSPRHIYLSPELLHWTKPSVSVQMVRTNISSEYSLPLTLRNIQNGTTVLIAAMFNKENVHNINDIQFDNNHYNLSSPYIERQHSLDSNKENINSIINSHPQNLHMINVSTKKQFDYQSSFQRIPLLAVYPGDVIEVLDTYNDLSSLQPSIMESTFPRSHPSTSMLETSWRSNKTNELKENSFYNLKSNLGRLSTCKQFIYGRCIAGTVKNHRGWFPASVCMGEGSNVQIGLITIPIGLRNLYGSILNNPLDDAFHKEMPFIMAESVINDTPQDSIMKHTSHSIVSMASSLTLDSIGMNTEMYSSSTSPRITESIMNLTKDSLDTVCINRTIEDSCLKGLYNANDYPKIHPLSSFESHHATLNELHHHLNCLPQLETMEEDLQQVLFSQVMDVFHLQESIKKSKNTSTELSYLSNLAPPYEVKHHLNTFDHSDKLKDTMTRVVNLCHQIKAVNDFNRNDMSHYNTIFPSLTELLLMGSAGSCVNDTTENIKRVSSFGEFIETYPSNPLTCKDEILCNKDSTQSMKLLNRTSISSISTSGDSIDIADTHPSFPLCKDDNTVVSSRLHHCV